MFLPLADSAGADRGPVQTLAAFDWRPGGVSRRDAQTLVADCCRKSAACIIVMSAVPHKGIFGAIPPALAGAAPVRRDKSV